jgi:hypothetical protein
MKSLFFIALSVVALVPTIAGTAVPNNSLPANSAVSAMALMKAQAASSDAILSRPL